jgi:LPXTG-motif cell wall-anchored protein
MRRTTTILTVALAVFLVAGLALAQNADKNSAGPTKNDLKIRVTEPLEGARIIGTSARVAIDFDRSMYREQGATDKGLDKFPPPTFDVFLDNNLRQSLKGGTNVATIDNITPGSHKIVVLAKNLSGEVVDRKEINITAAAAVIAESTTRETTIATAPAPAPEPVAPAPAPAPVQSYSPPPAPAPAAPMETTLPHTGTAAPRAALLGLVLVAAGFLVGRKKTR